MSSARVPEAARRGHLERRRPGCSAAAGAGAAAAGAPRRPAAPAPPKPMPAQLPEVLARVNGEAVKKVDFDRLIKNMELSANQPVPAERRDEILRAGARPAGDLHRAVAGNDDAAT